MRSLSVLLVVILAGCARPLCERKMEAQLYFGVTGAAGFAEFLDREVTPRFPAGLTVLDAAGRWRDPAGRLTHESSKLVLIVTEPGAATLARLQAIRDAYKAQFQQQSVGLVLESVCADF
jgi:hypothetical protein